MNETVASGYVHELRRARLVIWIGLGANLFMVGAFLITIALPHPTRLHGRCKPKKTESLSASMGYLKTKLLMSRRSHQR